MKAYNRNIKKVILFSVLFTFATSCNNDFLEVPPQGVLTPEDLFATEDAASQLVTAIYNNLLQWSTHSFSWIGVSSITSDNADKGSDPGDTGTDKNMLDEWTFSTDALSFNEIWQSHFLGIMLANRALDIIPKTDLDQAVKEQLEGESRFLRAYYYFNLVRCFGGVPLIDGIPDLTNEEDVMAANTRSTVDEVYVFIKEDLEYASEHLASVTNQPSSRVGHATSGAAKTMLAKVNMYQKNWNEVLRLTNEIIASNEYSLLTDYNLIWRESGENCSESIFEVQANGDLSTPLSIVQYNEVQAVRTQFGWGFNTPSDDLENCYEPGDTRKDATILYPGEVLWDGVEIVSDPPNPRYNQKAYVSNPRSWSSTNYNLRIFRYAEVLLMNAEAANELGNTSLALNSLNEVRRRATLKDTSGSDADQLRNIIWHERRVELAMEHDRTFDLRRQGRAGEVMRSLGFNYIDGKHDLFPIPEKQIELSGGLLEQNPNY